MTEFVEANFDGLVGPTHHYGGLAYGNVASEKHAHSVSRPRNAALQGIAKMRALSNRGVVQGVLPPQERPHVPTLRALGFTGSDAQVVAHAARDAPHLLEAVSSASAMWAANAATVSPSPDTADGRIHFTPANLASHLHRAMEAPTTRRALEHLFPDESRFAVHAPLPAALPDEGAANHTRLARHHGAPGVELFVYGRGNVEVPRRYPARQHADASRAIARRHGVAAAVFVQQTPAVIDQGVFHNDVIAVGHRNLLLRHEDAWQDGDEVEQRLAEHVDDLRTVVVGADEIPVDVAVRTYLFNSQLVDTDVGTLLVAPEEVRDDTGVWGFVQDRLVADGFVDDVLVFDLRQSMRNGGGPACLRLRVVMSPDEMTAVHQPALFDERLDRRLTSWVQRHYREELTSEELADPVLLDETRAALEELTDIMDLGQFYEFQQ